MIDKFEERAREIVAYVDECWLWGEIQEDKLAGFISTALRQAHAQGAEEAADLVGRLATPRSSEWVHIAKRIRALLPKDDGKGEG